MTAPDHTLKPFKNHLHQRGHPYMSQSGDGRISPFPVGTDPTASGTGMPKAVKPFRTARHMELGDLTIEVPRHEVLAEQFDTVHLGFDSASAVIAAPSSSEGSTEAA